MILQFSDIPQYTFYISKKSYPEQKKSYPSRFDPKKDEFLPKNTTLLRHQHGLAHPLPKWPTCHPLVSVLR